MSTELLQTTNPSDTYYQEEPVFVVDSDVAGLPGVGFHPTLEVAVLKRDLQEESEDRRGILENWLEKSKRNLLGYWQEYIDQRLVLPIELEFAEVDGKKRVVQKNIKNSVWVNAVSESERNGSVKDSVKKIEEFLLAAPPNSIAVLVSPGGTEYPDTQTYIFWVDPNGQIDAMTVRTDPNISDNEGFLYNSDANFDTKTDVPLNSRVEHIIKSPLLLMAEDAFAFTPEGIIETIRATKTDLTAFKGKEFSHLYADFNDRFNFLEATASIGVVVSEFYSFCSDLVSNSDFVFSEDIFLKIQEKVGETILKMSYIKRYLQGSGFSQETIYYRLHNLSRRDYENELRYLQTIPGCAGGGLGNYYDNGLGLREIIVNVEAAGLSSCCQAKIICGCCCTCKRVIIKM